MVSYGSGSTTIDMSYEAEAALFFKLALESEHSGEGQLSPLRFMMITNEGKSCHREFRVLKAPKPSIP